MASGWVAYSASNVSRGRCARSIHDRAPIITVQATEASARASDSSARIASGTDASRPPCVAGRTSRKQAATRRLLSRSTGTRRPVSISLARSKIDGASWRTAWRTVSTVIVSRVMVIVAPSGPQHRRFGGVASTQLVVPAAVAVAGRLDDLAVVHDAVPQLAGHLGALAVLGLLVFHEEAVGGRYDAQDL